MHHSLQFLIDLTFNLSLVEEYPTLDMKRVESMLKLVLSAELFPKLSFMSLQPACLSNDEAMETSAAEKRPSGSCVRRGRDAPFPAPVHRCRPGSSIPANTLLHHRYSRPTPTVVVTPPPHDDIDEEEPASNSRGRSLYKETRQFSEANSYKDAPLRPSLVRRDGLLRVVPFPPGHHRTAHESETGQHKRIAHSLYVPKARKGRPTSKRITFIPPPLNLPPGYIQRMDEESDYEMGFSDTDVLPEPELLHTRKQSLRRQISCRPAPLLSGGYF